MRKSTKQVFETIYDISKTSCFEVKTTEAMHYRRFLAQKQGRPDTASRTAFRTAGVSDGKGFVFVSHLGDIYPSGFLPVYGGNVRRNSLVDVYRNSRPIPDPARHNGSRGEMWNLRVSQDLRRIPGARLLEYRQLYGGRSAMRVPANRIAGPTPGKKRAYRPRRIEILNGSTSPF